ncbi:hypothetical protein GMMP1_90003 [Candidatus Magnetomoraceae bacterium gMMP-1]
MTKMADIFNGAIKAHGYDLITVLFFETETGYKATANKWNDKTEKYDYRKTICECEDLGNAELKALQWAGKHNY